LAGNARASLHADRMVCCLSRCGPAAWHLAVFVRAVAAKLLAPLITLSSGHASYRFEHEHAACCLCSHGPAAWHLVGCRAGAVADELLINWGIIAYQVA